MQGIGCGTLWNYGMVRLNFEEKYATQLQKVFSGILRYGTKIRYFFCTVPYSFRRANPKSQKDLLC